MGSTNCLKNEYFQKLIMNGNRSKGIICKSKEEEDGVWD
jgi:hypothetical protein